MNGAELDDMALYGCVSQGLGATEFMTEFDWLKSVLKAFQIFPSRLVMF